MLKRIPLNGIAALIPNIVTCDIHLHILKTHSPVLALSLMVQYKFLISTDVHHPCFPILPFLLFDDDKETVLLLSIDVNNQLCEQEHTSELTATMDSVMFSCSNDLHHPQRFCYVAIAAETLRKLRCRIFGIVIRTRRWSKVTFNGN